MSRDTVDPFFFALFPSFFIGIWLLVTTVAGLVSGWFELMRRFPDRDEGAILRIGFVSGTMGPLVRFNGLLTLSASVSGLRVGMLRLLGPFCRDFLVPWEEITVTRTSNWFSSMAKLHFGIPVAGTLSISAVTADRLAHAAGRTLPESKRPA